MKNCNQKLIVLLTIVSSLFVRISYAQSYGTNAIQGKPDFQWPEGKKMAWSVSFDDARLTQIDNGIPLFDKYGVKVTFYVSTYSMKPQMEAWKRAAKNGHEIGNHSLRHPCN